MGGVSVAGLVSGGGGRLRRRKEGVRREPSGSDAVLMRGRGRRLEVALDWWGRPAATFSGWLSGGSPGATEMCVLPSGGDLPGRLESVRERALV